MWPVWWKLNHGQTKVHPVHVCFNTISVSFYVSLPLLFPRYWMSPRPSRTLLECPPSTACLALPGPSTTRIAEHLLELVSTLFTCNPPSHALVVSKHIALTLAHAAYKRIWWPAPSLEVELRYIDDADTIVPSLMSNQMRLKVMPQSPKCTLLLLQPYVLHHRKSIWNRGQ